MHNKTTHFQRGRILRVPHPSQSHREGWGIRALREPLSLPGWKYIVTLLVASTLTAHAQWDIQESHTTASLRGVHNVGSGVAWASGTNGTVLRTTDNGANWQTCPTPPGAEKLDFRGIQAFDENTAIVMSSGKGDLSRLYKTTDGCRTWKLLFTNPDKEGFWDAIAFTQKPRNAQERCFGTVVGDPVERHFAIFLTLDCGDSWEKQIRQSPEALPPGEGLFAASNSSLIVYGPQARKFVTGGEGGAREMYFWVGVDDTNQPDPLKVMPGAKEFRMVSRGWNVEPLPNPSPNVSSGAFSIADDGYHSVIVGGDYSHTEKGLAWYEGSYRLADKTLWHLSIHPPHGYRSSVAYDPTTKTWITVGPNGTDISTDDGKNWRPLKPTATDPPDADKNWNALSLPFVVGPKGRIGKLRPTTINTAVKP